ncbi:Glutaconyl-CoA decarboxylase subunit gamma [Jeotgalibaca dankookensis]|uniref:Glutaconyl-CoA decarboxylase subunit gamma n=2 Tax=Jeotgalibaca dankookensis TaxID=708126 RepID=A0A1S6IQZ8_9LACT|nr:Glutaconyl-CoA decarboxylase subunit gamma [Jeotgalibaca dankookensis]
MMKTYEVEVNGKVYAVKIKEVDEASFDNLSQSATPSSSSPASASTSGSGIAVNSPMPGKIVSVKVTVGQQVNAGDTLCVLEAMKMENEVVAPEDGTVREVLVSEGQSVDSGDVLLRL